MCEDRHLGHRFPSMVNHIVCGRGGEGPLVAGCAVWAGVVPRLRGAVWKAGHVTLWELEILGANFGSKYFGIRDILRNLDFVT